MKHLRIKDGAVIEEHDPEGKPDQQTDNAIGKGIGAAVLIGLTIAIALFCFVCYLIGMAL